MEKIKWSYDKKFKEWWINETSPYAMDHMNIENVGGKYELTKGVLRVGRFKKLSSAKIVANLLRHG